MIMKQPLHRRAFIKNTSLATLGLVCAKPLSTFNHQAVKRIGVIGLDTGHSVAFTRLLNDENADAVFAGYRVVAAYPHGSRDIETSLKMIPGNTENIKKLGVQITGSIEELLSMSDVVLLETNDGRLHLEQALQVMKAGKPLFIDKPVAASLADAISIFEAASHYNIPVFSSSSLRFMESARQVMNGKIGKVVGADVYSPAIIEKTHPDLFWYGVHGVETLYTIMGTGCKTVSRFHTELSDIVVGNWPGNRIGTFRGIRNSKTGYGGTAFGETGIATIGPFEGYRPLLVQIIEFFRTGKSPVSAEETLEIFAFMEAAEESKRKNGAAISLASTLQKARKQSKKNRSL